MARRYLNLAAFSSLIPVGIGSVIGTIFLTNINKPVFEKIALLNIEDELPEESEETEIIAKIKADKDQDGGTSEDVGSVDTSDETQDNEKTTGEKDDASSVSLEPEKKKDEESKEKGKDEKQESTNQESDTPQIMEPEEVIRKLIIKFGEMNIYEITNSLYGIFSLTEDLDKFNQAINQLKPETQTQETKDK